MGDHCNRRVQKIRGSFRILVLFQLVFAGISSIAQSAWTSELFLNPYLQRLGKSHIEHGDPHMYEFDERKKWQTELGVRVYRSINERLDAGLGLGIKNIFYGFATHLTNPLEPSSVIEIIEGEISMLMLTPYLSMKYEIGKFNIMGGIEINVPVNSASTFEELNTRFIGFFEPPDKFAALNIYVPPSFEYAYASFIIPELRLSYKLTPFAVHCGAKMKPYGNRYLYALKVDGFSSLFPTSDVERLHTTIVYNRMIMPYIGCSFSFEFRKKGGKKSIHSER